ncbi:MAG: sugar transferase [Bacteroidales bacterium]|nr:sugar transferase [Bacteroidales bacterium]
MILKRLFDIVASLCGLLLIWWVYPIVAILIKIKMPGGPAFFCQKRVGKDGKLFTCHKFRTMTVKHNGSSISVAGDNRITPLGATLRHYKIDELPELWDVLIGNMSFVGPRPDVPGYADKLEGDDRDVLKLRPGITGPATLKYRLEDEQIAAFVAQVRNLNDNDDTSTSSAQAENLGFALPENVKAMSDQELAVWYNDNVIYPDKVRLNCYYYRHYSFFKDIEMIFATVLGWKIKFSGEEF